MNKIWIIGNLTRDPELRSTDKGIPVCGFTVAVNRRKSGAEAGKQDADFMRVDAWRELGETCNRYLKKGSKVAVIGSVKVNSYMGHDGKPHAQIGIDATEVEFLSPRSQEESTEAKEQPAVQPGFIKVDDEELPF